MSKTLYDVTLLELIPENLRHDPDIIAASKAVDTQFQELAQSIKNCLTIADIDHASSEVVDHLAAQMNVDFYDQTLPIAKRRALVKNGYIFKYLKGTPYVVKLVVSDAFREAVVQEWFEYGGDPGYFRVTTEANLPDIATINNIFRAIRAVKNERSWLEVLAALKRADLNNIFFAAATHQATYHKIVLEV